MASGKAASYLIRATADAAIAAPATAAAIVLEEIVVTARKRDEAFRNRKYNAGFSPGGFLFRALPRRYGLQFDYRFQGG